MILIAFVDAKMHQSILMNGYHSIDKKNFIDFSLVTRRLSVYFSKHSLNFHFRMTPIKYNQLKC